MNPQNQLLSEQNFFGTLCIFSRESDSRIANVRNSVCPSVRPSVRLSVCPSVRLSVRNQLLKMTYLTAYDI